MVNQPADPEDVRPEFVRSVALEKIGPDGLDLEIEADPEERGRLVGRFNLVSLERLAAQLRLAISPSGISIRIAGRFQAHVSQECIVSLEPVESNIDLPLEAEFGPAAAETEVSVSPDGPEPVEPLVDGRIDIGELVVQNLAFALDPYPRRPDAQPLKSAEDADESGKIEGGGPFSALATLRKKDG